MRFSFVQGEKTIFLELQDQEQYCVCYVEFTGNSQEQFSQNFANYDIAYSKFKEILYIL